MLHRNVMIWIILLMLLALPSARISMLGRNVQSQKGIVVIESDQALAKIFAKIFENRGYKVILKMDQKHNPKLRIKSDTKPPQAEIANPPNGSYVSGNISLTIVASDNTSVDTVRLIIDGTTVKTWSGAGTYKYYWYTPSYADGPHNVTIWANDTSGNTNFTYYEYIVDNQAPTVSITSPGDGAYIGGSSVTVSWTGNDNYQVDHYEVSLDDGSPIDVGADTSYTFTNLGEGKHNVTVYVYDLAGNMNFDVVYFTVDISDPIVSITSPSDGSWTNIENITVTWSADDYVSGIDHYEVRIYNSSWSSAWIDVGLSTNYTFRNLAEGQYAVDVVAYDKAGNTGTDSVTIGVDLSAPQITITDPGEYVGGASVMVRWTYSDMSGLDYFEVRLKNSTWDSGWINVGTSTSYTFSGLTEGTYTVYVRGLDLAGNMGLSSKAFIVDLTPPSVSISEPPNDSWTTQYSFNISWTASDNNILARYTVYVNGSEVESGTLSGSSVSKTTQIIVSSDGHYNVTVEVWDGANNSASDSIIIHVDSTKPNIKITKPTNGSTVGSTFLVWWSGTDNMKIVRIDVYLNGSLNTTYYYDSSSITGSHKFQDLEVDVDYNVTVVAYDNAGNRDRSYIIVHTSALYVDIYNPENYDAFNRSWVMVNWTYEVAISFDIYVNTTKIGTTTNSWYNVTDLSEGLWNITVVGYDDAGNSAYDTVFVYIDFMAPQLLIISPSNNSYLNYTDVNITWDGSDNLSGVAYYNISIDDGGWINNSKQEWYLAQNLPTGMHNVRIRAVDRAGNIEEKKILFTVDLSPPDLTITSPSNDTVFNRNTFTVEWTATDDNGIDHYEIRLNNGAWLDIGVSNSYTYSGLPDGYYEVYVRAFDLAGNTDTDMVRVYVDTSPPSTTIVSPLNNSDVGTTFVLTWNASDDTSWISKAEIFVNDSLYTTHTYSGKQKYVEDSETISGLQAPATYNVTIKVYDAAGWFSIYTIWVHTIPLSVEIVSPDNESYFNRTWVLVEWIGSGANIDHYELYVNGSLVNGSIPAGTSSYNVTDLFEGTHNITIVVWDTEGKSDWDSIIIYVDLTEPTVNIVSPPNGSYVRGVLDIELNVEEQFLENVTLYIDGVSVYTGFSNSIIHPWDTTTVEDGKHIIKAVAYDRAGNRGYDLIIVFVDNTAPTVEWISPNNSSLISGAIQVSMKISEDNLYSASLSINGSVVDAWSENNTHIYNWDTSGYTDGRYNLTVYAEDLAGNNVSSTIFVDVDNTPPTIDIVAPSDGDVVGGIVEIVISVDDPHNAFSELRINTTSVDSWAGVGTHTYEWDTTGYSDGYWEINVTSVDNAGNRVSRRIIVFVDNSPPVVRIGAPANGSYHGGVVTIVVSADDRNPNILELYINDSLVASTTQFDSFTYDWDTTAVSDGPYIINATAKDSAGNVGYNYIFVWVDNTRPSVVIRDLSNGTYINSTSLNITWSASDNMGLDYFEVRLMVNYTETLLTDKLSGDSRWYILDNLDEGGEYEFIVKAYDYARNEDTSEVRFYVDLTPPSVWIIDITNSKYVADTDLYYVLPSFNVWVGFEDNPYSQQIVINTYLNGTLHNTTILAQYSGSTQIRFRLNDTCIDNYYNLSVEAVDCAGWRSLISVMIKVVRLDIHIYEPRTYLVGGVLYAYVNTTNITVVWDFVPFGRYVNNVTLYMNGERIYSTNNNITSYIFAGLTVGDWNNITIFTNDTKNNSVTKTMLVYVDIVPPEVWFVGIDPLFYNASLDLNITWTNMTISWNGSDDVGILAYYLRLDEDSWMDVGTNTSLYLTGIAGGEHILYIKAVDLAGNTKIIDMKIYVDVLGPEITVYLPQPPFVEGYYNLSLIQINISLFDTSNYSLPITIIINGTSTISLNNLSFVLSLDTEGIYNLSFVIKDIFGNEAKKSIVLVIDKTPPILDVKVLVDNPNNITSPEVPISWMANDYLSGIYLVRLRVDGGDWQNVSEEGNIVLRLVSGDHIIEFEAYDKAGNYDMKTISVHVSAPPEVVVGLLGYVFVEYYFNETSFSLAINITAYAEFNISIYIDDSLVLQESYDSGSYMITYPINISDEGQHKVRVLIVDSEGYSFDKSFDVVVDLTAPIVEILSPHQNEEITGKVNLTWRTHDELSGIYNVIVLIDGELSGNEWDESGSRLITLSEGEHSIVVVAFDLAGNRGYDEVRFVVKPPTLPFDLRMVIVMIILTVPVAALIILKKRRRLGVPSEPTAEEVIVEIAESFEEEQI